jgi:endonuclease/exonuclease/phosphatase family metal-dependent hydrolase
VTRPAAISLDATGDASGAAGAAVAGHRLRVLSYNIQTGLATTRYREYVTKGWRYLLPHSDRTQTLHRIASLVRSFDIVGLQETDAGSLRTAFLNQTEFLARHAGLAHWYEQINRPLGAVARHSNGLLARVRPHEVDDFKLPGAPGRGVLVARFGAREQPLVVLVAHLALGKRSRARQLEFLAEKIARWRHVILMGDLNCDLDSHELRVLLDATGLGSVEGEAHTYPSWRREISVLRSYVPPARLSDHLPVAMEVLIPASVRLTV